MKKGVWIAIVILVAMAIAVVGYIFYGNGVLKGNFYYLEHGDFTVFFPDEPIYLSPAPQVKLLDKNVTEDVYTFEMGATYGLQVYHIGSAFKNGQSPEDNLKKEVVAQNTNLISSKLTSYNGVPAVDYFSYNTDSNIYSVGKDILNGNDLYELVYAYPAGQEDKKLENSFLNSLVFGRKDGALDVTYSLDLSKNSGQSQQNKTSDINTTDIAQTPVITKVASDLPTIIQHWQKSTAYVECYWSYNDKWYYKQSGSGLLAMLGSVPTVITNKHVVTSTQYGSPTECDVGFPDNNHVYYSVSTVDQPAVGNLPDFPAHGQIQVTSDGSDVAYLSNMKEESLGTPASISLSDRAVTGNFTCSASPMGEPLVILGYPDYGTDAGSLVNVFSDLQVTATEGIISGKDGIYYTTSAKLEHGNSGGLAVDEKNNCYIGIPTAFVSGQADSLGRILPASYAVSNN
jgi:hypothetical protein